MITDPIEIALQVSRIFESLSVPHMIAGSVASSLHGEDRTTHDVDFVADLEPSHVDAFVAALGDAYFADRITIDAAVRARSSFNIIHLESMFKVDIYVMRQTESDREEMARRRREQVRRDPDAFAFVSTPEDVVLKKLVWFRMGGGVSDRQWRDIRGVLKAQARSLDRAYLRRVASELGVLELLNRALVEAGLAPDNS